MVNMDFEFDVFCVSQLSDAGLSSESSHDDEMMGQLRSILPDVTNPGASHHHHPQPPRVSRSSSHHYSSSATSSEQTETDDSEVSVLTLLFLEEKIYYPVARRFKIFLVNARFVLIWD